MFTAAVENDEQMPVVAQSFKMVAFRSLNTGKDLAEGWFATSMFLQGLKLFNSGYGFPSVIS